MKNKNKLYYSLCFLLKSIENVYFSTNNIILIKELVHSGGLPITET